MARRILIAGACVAAFAFFGLAAADTNAPVSSSATSGICATTLCRTAPYRVDILAKDGANRYRITFDPQPYVVDGAITILPGETLIFHVTETADGLGIPVFVSARIDAAPTKLPSDFAQDPTTGVQHDPKTGENVYWLKAGSPNLEGGTAEEHLKDAPPGTLILSYHQAVGRPDMVLRLEHNLSKPLKYDALMVALTPEDAGDPTATSTCPVAPKVAGLETWPYPLGALTLRNFRFMNMSSGFNCT
jgi:hypothetical protein